MYPYAEIILKKENQKHYNRKQHTNSHFKNKFIIFASCATISDKNFRSHHILSRLDNFYFFTAMSWQRLSRVHTPLYESDHTTS